jgi:hypothetical protein
MSRYTLLLLAGSLTAMAGAVGCTHCDTCDDFPTPCSGPNCGLQGYVPYGTDAAAGPGYQSPAPAATPPAGDATQSAPSTGDVPSTGPFGTPSAPEANPTPGAASPTKPDSPPTAPENAETTPSANPAANPPAGTTSPNTSAPNANP